MTRLLGLSAFALAVGLVAAPRAQAQMSTQVLVCRDGQVTSAGYGARACDRHGGVDQRTTLRTRQNGVSANYDDRGIYRGGTNGTVYGQRGIYTGGVVIGPRRPIYGGILGIPGTSSHHDNGKHLGWYKGHGDHDRDRDRGRGRDRDRDDRRW